MKSMLSVQLILIPILGRVSKVLDHLIEKAKLKYKFPIKLRFSDKKVEKIAGQPSPPTPVKTAPRQFPSKIANRKRKAPKLSVSAKKKRPVNIQNIIEKA